MTSELRKAWLATAIWFALNSFGVASFIVRLPEVKKTLDITNSTLGLALFIASLGSLASIKIVGKIAAKFGSSPLMFVGGIATAVSLPLISTLYSLSAFIATLLIFFVSITVMDISMNAHAVNIEHLANKLIMGRLHGIWSIGGVLGGVAGGVFASFETKLLLQGIIVGVITLLLVIVFRGFLLPASTDIHETETPEAKSTKHPRIFYVLGFVGLCAAVIEGSAADWGAVLITEEFGASGFVSSLPYIIFQTAMVIGRFSSDYLTSRFGRGPILLFCGSFVAFGLSIGLIIGGQVAIVLAWFAMGVGASVVIPMVFSIAGAIAKNEYEGVVAPSQAVATVSGISYAAFLIGPPIIGFLADLVSLRWAMLVPAFLAIGIIFGAKFANKGN